MCLGFSTTASFTLPTVKGKDSSFFVVASPFSFGVGLYFISNFIDYELLVEMVAFFPFALSVF